MNPSSVPSTTPPLRQSRGLSVAESPHSGYHWHGQAGRFFEGWYFRLTLPEPGQTFAFMYSIDDPAGGTDHAGGAAQILGPNDTYYCRTFPDVSQFWAWPHQLRLGHWRLSTAAGAARYLGGENFQREVKEGYQVSSRRHQGRLLNPLGGVEAAWDYHTVTMAGWGTPVQKATAGWLSYLPVFEPGWQVLMAHGLASGWVDWQGDRYTFNEAPAYAEKNWGGAFPAKWFWIQCNAFTDHPHLSVTAVAGVREVLAWTENVGLIGIHYEAKFYEFFSPDCTFTWHVEPWGHWHLSAENDRYRVMLTGRATDDGTWVRVPTREGLQFLCRDTTHGELHMQLWRRSHSTETLMLETASQLAGLEVGGGPWDERWVSD